MFLFAKVWQMVEIGKFWICSRPLGQDQARTNVRATQMEHENLILLKVCLWQFGTAVNACVCHLYSQCFKDKCFISKYIISKSQNIKCQNLKVFHLSGPFCCYEDAWPKPNGTRDCRPHQWDHKERTFVNTVSLSPTCIIHLWKDHICNGQN